ncbi:MAG TPA: hypothetical protein VKT83_13755 [bacterium]|nr:hypothetical protein [bacterium]
MDADCTQPRKRITRHERKRQHLGSSAPTCLSCGCIAVEMLFAVRACELPRWFLEKHHLAGRVAANMTVVLCRNCHAVVSDRQYDHDARLRCPSTGQERLAALLQGLADWFQVLGTWLLGLAGYLEEWVRWILDAMQGPGPSGAPA